MNTNKHKNKITINSTNIVILGIIFFKRYYILYFVKLVGIPLIQQNKVLNIF